MSRLNNKKQISIIIILSVVLILLIAALIILTNQGRTQDKADTATQSSAETAGTTVSTESDTESASGVPKTTAAETEPATVVESEAERDAYYSALVTEAQTIGRKIVYLTFDDGSGTLTPTVLDTLDKYNVKATFFVVGNYSPSEDFARTEYNDIISRGHTLGIHSFTHSRANIYESFDAFKADADHMYNYVTELTGRPPRFWRFPGGSATSFADSRMKSDYIPYIESLGMTYYDWNVSSGDGSGNITRDKVYQNVINGVTNKDVSVVLMHDGSGHDETVAALPSILDTLINEMNCLIVPITASTTPVQSQF